MGRSKKQIFLEKHFDYSHLMTNYKLIQNKIVIIWFRILCGVEWYQNCLLWIWFGHEASKCANVIKLLGRGLLLIHSSHHQITINFVMFDINELHVKWGIG